jgi:hypothetical protein
LPGNRSDAMRAGMRTIGFIETLEFLDFCDASPQ